MFARTGTFRIVASRRSDCRVLKDAVDPLATQDIPIKHGNAVALSVSWKCFSNDINSVIAAQLTVTYICFTLVNSI